MPTPDHLRTRKQAVVVIHGIGGQRPMATLANLVRTLVGERYGSKPDRMTGDTELRRLRALVDGLKGELGEHLETDFYELYWADIVQDTSLGSLLKWLWSLTWRPVDRGNAQRWRLRRLKLAGVGMVVIAAGAAMLVLTKGYRSPSTGIGILLGTGALGLLVKQFVLGPLLSVVGDAARYLSPEPENVAARREIRRAGVNLLTSLHEDRGVDRIVIVGHSLGSIIGYDIISQYWALKHVGTPVEAATLHALTAAGKALCAADPRSTSAGIVSPKVGASPTLWTQDAYVKAAALFQQVRQAAFEATRAYARKPRAPARQPGMAPEDRDYRPWLVSDFITVGSPLCYADFLFNGRAALEHSQAMGSVPSAPPEPLLDRDPIAVGKPASYGFKLHHSSRRYVYHHAAPFALTRWTNLYYPADPFSGPLREQYGIAIQDQELRGAPGEPRWWWRYNPLAHTRYWRTASGQPLEQARAILAGIIFRPAWPKPDAQAAMPRPRNLGGGGDGTSGEAA